MVKRRKQEDIAGVLEFEGRTSEDPEVMAWLAEHKARKGQRGAWIRGRGALTPTPPGVMRRGRSLGVPGPACG